MTVRVRKLDWVFGAGVVLSLGFGVRAAEAPNAKPATATVVWRPVPGKISGDGTRQNPYRGTDKHAGIADLLRASRG